MLIGTHNQKLHAVLVSTVAELEIERQTLTQHLIEIRTAHRDAARLARTDAANLSAMERTTQLYRKGTLARMRVNGALRDTRREMLRIESQL